MVSLRLGSSQRKRWERGKRSYTTIHVLKDSKGRGPPLELTIHVMVRYQAIKKWGKHGCQYLIYAALGEFSREEIAARYRGRFGIESSYLILGQPLVRTSSRFAALRFLQAGVGMLLQNEWVILRLQYASEGRQGPVGFRIREEMLRFEDLLQKLFRAVGFRLGNLTEITNHRRLPPRLRRQGLTIPVEL